MWTTSLSRFYFIVDNLINESFYYREALMLLGIPREFRVLYKILQITLNVQEHASSGGEDGEARVQFGVSEFFLL